MTDDKKHKFGNSITVMARSINGRLQMCEDKMIKVPKQVKKKEVPAKDDAAKTTGDKAGSSSNGKTSLDPKDRCVLGWEFLW